MLFQLGALLTIPHTSLWLLCEAYTSEVEPLIWAIFVIACDHITIRNILAKAVDRLPDPISFHHPASLLMLMV